MRFAGWYLKIAAGGAAIGACMELFMIHTGFCASLSPPFSIQPLLIFWLKSFVYEYGSQFHIFTC
jgi:hypothetical protein